MFSYRHAFHAGNHADVLKHAVLVQVLEYFNRKENPYWVIDTHAGAGIYDLRDEWALTSGEADEGLKRLLDADAVPPLVSRYLAEVAAFNPAGPIEIYPGSPWLALHALRLQDRLRLFELHPSEVETLNHNLRSMGRSALRQTAVYEADGFERLKSQLPPPCRRGVIIIDPSYEDKKDYRKTLQALEDGLKRFATGCFIVWYPLVQRREVQDMLRQLKRLKTPWLNVSLTVRKPASDGYGLHGSGMFVLNPPWTLHAELAQAMPWLSTTLRQDNQAAYVLERQEN